MSYIPKLLPYKHEGVWPSEHEKTNLYSVKLRVRISRKLNISNLGVTRGFARLLTSSPRISQGARKLVRTSGYLKRKLMSYMYYVQNDFYH